MATIETSNLDDLIHSLDGAADQMQQLCDSLLEAQADVVQPALSRSIANEGLIGETGRLKDSISRRKTKSGIRIGPKGEHHRYVPSGRRPGANGIVTAGYVGYIHDYGIPSRGIPAAKWLEKGVEKSLGQAYNAAAAAVDDFLKNNNL